MGTVASRPGRVCSMLRTKPRTGTPGPLDMAGIPALAGHILLLPGAREAAHPDHGPISRHVLWRGHAVAVKRQAIAPPRQHAEIVVIRVVFHHQDHDVLYLRKAVRAHAHRGLRAGVRVY